MWEGLRHSLICSSILHFQSYLQSYCEWAAKLKWDYVRRKLILMRLNNSIPHLLLREWGSAYWCELKDESCHLCGEPAVFCHVYSSQIIQTTDIHKSCIAVSQIHPLYGLCCPTQVVSCGGQKATSKHSKAFLLRLPYSKSWNIEILISLRMTSRKAFICLLPKERGVQVNLYNGQLSKESFSYHPLCIIEDQLLFSLIAMISGKFKARKDRGCVLQTLSNKGSFLGCNQGILHSGAV